MSNLRRSGGVRFSAPVTLRRGASRSILGVLYRPGTAYAPDDPGVLAKPQFFIMAPVGAPVSPSASDAGIRSDLAPEASEDPVELAFEDDAALEGED